MSAKPFHLGWFGTFSRTGWSGRWAGPDVRAWANGDFLIDLARAFERSGFDYMMFEDSVMVSDVYGGTMHTNLKYGSHGPKHDPLSLVPIIAKLTNHIGLITTASTSFYPPFMLARTMATLSHLSNGRTGWNIVTSSENLAAKNFGMEELPDHDERYNSADEFVDLVERLWGSWDDDAMLMDLETNTYVDGNKVRTIDFEGKYYKSRGPLNTLAPYGGKPIYCQAGSSPRGLQFAADHADTVLVVTTGVEAMKRYRTEVHQIMANGGRGPDSMKMMFVLSPIIADTDEEAQALKARSPRDPIERLATMSALTEIDFSVFDLDVPFEDEVEKLQTNGHRGTLATLAKLAKGGRTLREISQVQALTCVDIVGSPDTVAGMMAEVMEEVGGDGFLISNLRSRRETTAFCDGVVPILQRKGLVRTEYTGETLRDNLYAF